MSAEKAHLLLLVHRIPFPPNKGDKIRSYHLLKHLSRHYQVHLGYFVDDQHDLQYVDNVAALCSSSYFSPLHPWLAKLRSLKALLFNRALSLDYFFNPTMAAWVKETVARYQITNIVIFSSLSAMKLQNGL